MAVLILNFDLYFLKVKIMVLNICAKFHENQTCNVGEITNK